MAGKIKIGEIDQNIMNILHTVQFYHPSVGGAQEVVRQVSEQLVKRGHQVTVATTYSPRRNVHTINGVQIEEFNISGSSASGFQGDTQRYIDFILDSKFDVMMNYAAQQCASDLIFPVLDRIPFTKVFIPCGFSGLYSPQFSSYFQQMPDVLRRYDHLVFHASAYRDIEFARQHKIDHFSLIPNGASEREFGENDTTFRRQYQIPEGEPLLLTVSSHFALKGHRLIIETFRRARIGKATLVLIGNTLGIPGCLPKCRLHAQLVKGMSLGKKKVLLLDPPRRTVIEAYHAADLFLLGSRVEYSPLVLFEAMASKTPIITSACGNAEEIIRWSRSGVVVAPEQKKSDGTIRTDAGKMARAIEELNFDRMRRQQLATAGYEAWLERFTWEKIAIQYEELYLRLIKRHSSSVAK